MKKKMISLILICAIMFSSLHISANDQENTKNITESIEKVSVKGKKIKKTDAKKLTAASIRLLDKTIKNDKDGENVFISPTSVMYAFGMLENGAKGKTRREIQNNLFGKMKVSDSNRLLFKQMRNMKKDKFVKWNVANSVWISNREDVKVKKNFLKDAVSYFDADVFKTGFNDQAVEDVNGWVDNETNGMIPSIVDKLDKETVACLINAICFEGEWAEQFDESDIKDNQDFINLDKTKTKVTMMSCEGSGYFKLDGAYGFKKYYKGYKYAFAGIRIPKGKTPAEYINILSKHPKRFNKALSNMKSDKKVTITMPKFASDYSSILNKPLKKLGIKRVFNKNKANLYNMFKKDVSGNYYLNKVIHKTHIEVDENGTKAAAATALILEKNTAFLDEREELNIKLDRPFVYAIIDTDNNIPIFIGCMNSMDESQ